MTGTMEFPGDVDFTIEVTASTPSTAQMIGLSTNPNANSSLTIDFAFYIYDVLGTTRYVIYENGAGIGSNISYSVGDVFNIRRQSGIVTYYLNGALLYTSANSHSNSLYVDSSFFRDDTGRLASGSFSTRLIAC